MAKTESVAAQIKELLDEYSANVKEVTEKAAQQTAKETVQELKNTSPKSPRGGAYARSWTYKKQDGAYIVHNKKHYMLTHLLENGHVISNQYGDYGRWNPKNKHIQPAEQNGIEKFLQQIERDLG